jgi:translation initiation factor 2B subunit (eIF-2B alpha/beta/delta family)
MLAQKAYHRVDAMILGATDDFASNLFLSNKAGADQSPQMKRKR